VTSVLAAATKSTTLYAGRSEDLTSISSTADLGQSWSALHLDDDDSYGIWRLVPDPSDPATFYAISSSAFLFKTIDGGANWAALQNLDSAIFDLAVDPSSPQTLYASAPGNRGIAKSADGGTTWVTVQDATATRATSTASR
jgi:photosystem II stability/assembly factor-like uncharacterized protein